MMFDLTNDNFTLEGRRIFLVSGEIHYFRIKKELWDVHLRAAKEAGLFAVSTYVPWGWHESKEGVFDLDGSFCPECDLKSWIEKCHELGLYCIVKPGPFILAEYRGAGLPSWFLDRYGDEFKMHDSKGRIVRSDGGSLFNKAYLEKVTLWYDRVLPFLSKYEISRGGPVIMMQVCNEIGVFTWLVRQADYGNAVRERFISYIKSRFSSIDELNDQWGERYQDFDQVNLPPDGISPYKSREDRARDLEWHSFWRKYYGDYLRMLVRMARERGITIPLYHNLPGWIYGNGYEFPVNITMYQDLFRDKSELLFGVDHIPEFVSYRNLHDDRIINDITIAMQGRGPLFAAELQCGSREYHVVTNPREIELFYKACIANGIRGWNYYMFSQGRNPLQKGHSGDTFYWFNPLTAEGERTSAFPLVKRMNSIVSTLENIIVNSSRKAEVCVLFYPPYYATELERPEAGTSELGFIPSAIRRPAYFDGLLRALQWLNIDYDMVELRSEAAEEMKNYRQAWAFCTDEMNAGDQQAMVDYASSGGNLVIFPFLPDRELSQKPCTILRDALSVVPSGSESVESPLIDIYGLRDIKCANPQFIYPENRSEGMEIIARTIRGQACGFEKQLGNGTVIHLGTWIGFETEAHRRVYETILERSGAVLRHASSANKFITVRERFTDDSALLFIANYYNEEHTGRIFYSHPQTGEKIPVPYLHEKVTWPPLYGVLTPVCLEIADEMNVLHCTSDILNISMSREYVEIDLYGERDLAGEIVFEGSKAEMIKTAEIDGQASELTRSGNRIIINYHHRHKQEMTLKIRLQ